MSTKDLYCIDDNIYTQEELLSLGISMDKPEHVTIVLNNEELKGYITCIDNAYLVSCPDVTNGYVNAGDLINLKATIKPENYCIVYVKQADYIIAKINDNNINYLNITESLDQFYSHNDRLIIRDIVNVYQNDTEKVAYKDAVNIECDLNEMVELPTGIYFGKYEVTRALYKNIMDDDPSYSYPCTDIDGDCRPVDNIDLEKAVAFCNKLSIKEGLVPYYTDNCVESNVDGHEYGYRLPTKTEWETAALANTTNTYSGTDGSLPQGNNDAHQLVFTSDPVSYEINSNGEQIPVYDETSTFTDAPVNNCTNPNNTSIANVGDPELAKYAWTKFNVRTGECENIPQPADFISGYGQWKVYKYCGHYYKSNAYGQPGCRGDVNDNIFGTRAVGQKLPNEWGLYDMTGNASELTLTNGEVLFVGGDAACNTSKLYVGHNTYECKIAGFRICRNK